jgi:hypothetical protein
MMDRIAYIRPHVLAPASLDENIKSLRAAYR